MQFEQSTDEQIQIVEFYEHFQNLTRITKKKLQKLYKQSFSEQKTKIMFKLCIYQSLKVF